MDVEPRWPRSWSRRPSSTWPCSSSRRSTSAAAERRPSPTRSPPSTSASRSRGADARFAHRFAGGPAPERPPRAGTRHAPRERREWLRHLTAWSIRAALLGLGVLAVGDLDRTSALVNTAKLWTFVLAIDFLISYSYTLWPRRA